MAVLLCVPCLYLLSGFLTGVIGFGAHSNPVWSHLNFITSLISYFQVRSLSQALGTRTSAYLFTLPTQSNVFSVLSLLWLKVIRVGLKMLLFCQAFPFFMQETLSWIHRTWWLIWKRWRLKYKVSDDFTLKAFISPWDKLEEVTICRVHRWDALFSNASIQAKNYLRTIFASEYKILITTAYSSLNELPLSTSPAQFLTLLLLQTFLSLFSCSVVSNSLWPHGLKHPCPSPSPRACSNSCPLSQWCHPTISSSVVPFSSWTCLP